LAYVHRKRQIKIFYYENKGDTNSGSHSKTQVYPKQHLIVFLQREFSHSLKWLT